MAVRAVHSPSPTGLLEAHKELSFDAGRPKTPPIWRSQDEQGKRRNKGHTYADIAHATSLAARSISFFLPCIQAERVRSHHVHGAVKTRKETQKAIPTPGTSFTTHFLPIRSQSYLSNEKGRCQPISTFHLRLRSENWC